MTNLALVNATDLVAEELRTLLEERHDLWREMHLLATDPGDFGTLLEVRGAAAMVTDAREHNFDGVDVAIFFGPSDDYAPLLDDIPPAVLKILVSGLEIPGQGRPAIAGVNPHAIDRSENLISPHPAAIGLAHLGRALESFGPSWMSATAVMPVSMFGKDALDELLDQARDLLSFSTKTEFERLPGPLAFNMLESDLGRQIASQARSALGEDAPPLSVQAVHGGLFHGLGLAVHFGFGDTVPDVRDLVEALEHAPLLDFAAEPQRLGPKEIVGGRDILISEVRATGEGTFALWAALDPLTAGGAGNLVGLLEALSSPVTH